MKLHLSITITVSLILLLPLYSRGQNYILPQETAQLVIEEAAKSRIKDTIIHELNNRLLNDSLYMIKMKDNFEARIELLRGMLKDQVEIGKAKDRLIQSKDSEIRKYKNDRKIGLGVIAVITLLAIL